MRLSCIVRTFFLLLLALSTPRVALAIPGQPGTLDASWATLSLLGAGKVITPVGAGNAIANAIAVQPDGKVVLAGYCDAGGNQNFCVLRYNANGTIDASFGSAGSVITPVSITKSYANVLALQPDNKLVLAGYCHGITSTYFCALRYNGNGSVDSNFGTNGAVVTPIGTSGHNATAIALQPDGRLVLSGYCSVAGAQRFCALRYTANGTLDPTFGVGGSTTTLIGTDSNANALAVQPDGKLLLAGSCASGGYHFCALRYNTDGTLDISFGSGGKIITNISAAAGDSAYAIAVQPDGRIVLAGACTGASSSLNFCALRYNTDGTLDSSFGVGGSVITSVTGNAAVNYATSVALQPDGGLLLAGNCVNQFCAIRYQSNGTLDTGFSSASTPLGSGSNTSTTGALQPDGRLLVAGYCYNGSTNFNFCAIRYDGGPFGYKACTLDIDGDNVVLATTDMLIGTRIALGMTGPGVISGITFPANAPRNTWPLIRDYLVTQCGMSLVQ